MKIGAILAVLAIGPVAVRAEGLVFLNPSNTTASVKVEGNRLDLLGQRQAESNEVDVTAWPRDKVFLTVGDDRFLWGPVWDYIEIYLNAKTISVPPGSTFEDIQAIKVKLAAVCAKSVAKTYLPAALLAQEARRMGLTEADSPIVRTNLVEQYVNSFPAKYQKAVRERLFAPDGYYTHCFDTMLLGDAYREKVLRPQIEVSAEEIANAIQAVEQKNREIVALNAQMGPAMEQLRSEIVEGKISFADAARQYSDCDSAELGGYWGRFDPEDCNLLEEIKAVVFTLPTNTISKVVETPFSYHIFRVMDPQEKLSLPDDEDADIDDEDDEEEDDDEEIDPGAPVGKAIRLCHIMFEKKQLKTVPTPEKARKRLYDRKLDEAVNVTAAKLQETVPVSCAIPGFKLRLGSADKKSKGKGLKPFQTNTQKENP